MLEAALAAEPLRTGEHGEGAALLDAHSRLIRAARKSGDFVAESDWSAFGERKRRQSGESEVFFNPARNYYTKFKNPAAKAAIKRTSPDDWIYEHILHNALFANARYDFLGVAECRGEARVVLGQKGIDAELRASDRQVSEIFKGMGLAPEDHFFFGNELFAITDVGQGGDNALISDDGQVVFIDPLIRVKRPVREIIGILLSLCPS